MTGDFIQIAVLGAKTQEKKIEGMGLVNYQFCLAEFMFQRMLSLPFLIFGKRFYNNEWFGKEKLVNEKSRDLRRVVASEIEKAKVKLSQDGLGKEMKLLDYFIMSMEKNEDLRKSDIDLTNENQMIVGAGVETTAHYILNCFILLNDHPEVLKKLKQEIDENLKTDDDFTYEKINSLQYLAAFIKEALRMGHPLPLGLMKQFEVDCKLGNYHFPKNTIFLNGFALNFVKSKYYKDPEEFRPERWLKNDVVQENINDEPGSFIPFSIGPRSCIGSQFALMESKVVVARFIRRFNFELLTKVIVEICGDLWTL